MPGPLLLVEVVVVLEVVLLVLVVFFTVAQAPLDGSELPAEL
jgi:hypothetical protein